MPPIWTLFFLFMSPSTQAADFQDQLAEFAKPFVLTVARPEHVYHWTEYQHIVHAPDKESLQPMDQRTRDYAYFTKQSFWDVNYRPTGDIDLGAGFYVAIDPVVTQSFGGSGSNSWALLQAILPAGTRYLAVDKNSAFPGALKEALQGACPVGSLKEIFEKAHLFGCRAVRDKMITQLDLSALRYRYKSQSLATCKVRPPYAFILFDDRAMQLDRMVSFTSSLPATPDAFSENRLIIDAIFAAAGAKPLWPKDKGIKAQADIPAWLKQNLIGCGGPSED